MQMLYYNANAQMALHKLIPVWAFYQCETLVPAESYVVTWSETQSRVLTAPRCFLTNKLLCVFCFTSVLNASLSSPEGDMPLSHISS